MKKLFPLFFILLLSLTSQAQGIVGPNPVRYSLTDPTGVVCDSTSPPLVYSTGTSRRIYSCVSGVYAVAGTGSGTVTSVSVTTANGVSGSVATATSTPAITLSLGNITPTSVTTQGAATDGVVLKGSTQLEGSKISFQRASGFEMFSLKWANPTLLNSSFVLDNANGNDTVFRVTAVDKVTILGSTGNLKLASGLNFTNLAYSVTAPTVTSAGTSPSITANNGTAAFIINVGTGGTATDIVLAMPTATAGWICHATNITATAANRADQAVRQTASTTTSVTLQNQTVSTGAALAFTASDLVRCQCTAY